MQLVRMKDGRIGLLVLLHRGPHVIDIANSLAVFAPHDLLSSGLLRGALKDNGDWSSIVKHSGYLRGPLKKLASIARANPDHPALALQPYTEQLPESGAADQVIAIEIANTDPLRRSGLQRQVNANERSAARVGEAAEIIDFPHRDRTGRCGQ